MQKQFHSAFSVPLFLHHLCEHLDLLYLVQLIGKFAPMWVPLGYCQSSQPYFVLWRCTIYWTKSSWTVRFSVSTSVFTKCIPWLTGSFYLRPHLLNLLLPDDNLLTLTFGIVFGKDTSGFLPGWNSMDTDLEFPNRIFFKTSKAESFFDLLKIPLFQNDSGLFCMYVGDNRLL